MRQPRVRLMNLHPTYARGLAEYLNDAGYLDTEVISESEFCHHRPNSSALILGVASQRDVDLLAYKCEKSTVGPIIALIQVESASLLIECLKRGAQSALPITAAPTAVILALQAAHYEQSILPTYVATRIASSRHWPPPDVSLSDEQLRWISRIAHGETVARLARDEGYSRRTMFLLLKGTYRDLDVRDRTEAIIKLAHDGFL